MTLPASRNTTYGEEEPVLSADLNAIQDAIVALNKPFNIQPAPGGYNADASADPQFGGSVVGSKTAVGATVWNTPIPLPEGSALDKVTVRILEPNGIGERFSMRLYVNNGGDTQIGDTITSANSGAQAYVVWDDATNDSGGDFPYTMQPGDKLRFRVAFLQTSVALEARVDNIEIERS